MKILGLERLPDDTLFSRFKRRLGSSMDKLVAMLTGMIQKENPLLYVKLGVDSTKVKAQSKKDKQAG
jgi:hypothetical protein